MTPQQIAIRASRAMAATGLAHQRALAQVAAYRNAWSEEGKARYAAALEAERQAERAYRVAVRDAIIASNAVPGADQQPVPVLS